jgi:prepilin-type N-terminal cleavage/methylation domain-containing protein
MIMNQRGFTLLEVLVAIVLFSVATLLFSSMFVSSFQQSKNEDTQLVAINLARQVASGWGSMSNDEVISAVKNAEGISLQDTTKPIQFPKKVTDQNIPDQYNIDIPDQYTINERTYQSIVTINKLDPILIITVEITSPGSSKILATVHACVGQ